MTEPISDLTRPLAPMTRQQRRGRRFRLAAAWILLSIWEGVPIYCAFMALSENPSKEVAVALSLSLCWVPVVGTASAIMAAVWAWGLPWWATVAMYVGPKVALLVIARAAELRYRRSGR